jgi:hypothetical protein
VDCRATKCLSIVLVIVELISVAFLSGDCLIYGSLVLRLMLFSRYFEASIFLAGPVS